MKANYLFLLMSLFCFGLSAQDWPSEYICWSKDRQLKWSDFKGDPDTTGWYIIVKAATAATLVVDGGWKDGLPDYEVTCIFENQRSWTKDTTSLELLRHEQIHFNIAELYARKLRKAFDSLRMLGVDHIEKYDQLTNRIFRDRDLTDEVFDKATSYSAHKAAQDEWYAKVRAEMKALVEYSSDKMDNKCISVDGTAE